MLRRSRLHNLSNRRLCSSNLPSSSSSNSPSSHRATIIAATSISIALSSSSSTTPSSNSISGRSTRSTSSLKASMEVEGRIISSLSSTSSSTTTDSSSSNSNSSTCSISRGSRARRRTTSKCPCLTSNLSPTAIMALTKRRIQALTHSPNLQTKIARLSQLTRPSERISERKGEGGKSGEKENALLEGKQL